MYEQRENHFDCPYCGEPISVLVDMSVTEQSYIEDCEVCCRPISLHCTVDDETLQLRAERCD